MFGIKVINVKSCPSQVFYHKLIKWKDSYHKNSFYTMWDSDANLFLKRLLKMLLQTG